MVAHLLIASPFVTLPTRITVSENPGHDEFGREEPATAVVMAEAVTEKTLGEQS